MGPVLLNCLDQERQEKGILFGGYWLLRKKSQIRIIPHFGEMSLSRCFLVY